MVLRMFLKESTMRFHPGLLTTHVSDTLSLLLFPMLYLDLERAWEPRKGWERLLIIGEGASLLLCLTLTRMYSRSEDVLEHSVILLPLIPLVTV